MSAPTIRAELAAAVRRVNAAFNRLTPAQQDSLEIGTDTLEREVDVAALADDRPRAMLAINPLQRHWLATFEEAAR